MNKLVERFSAEMEEEERVDRILREEDIRTETDFSLDSCNESCRTVTDDADVSDSDKE